ncbi:MAG: permease [Proteobacteria bacterium]|nr:permease [Pseudomonadota bacterium]
MNTLNAELVGRRPRIAIAWRALWPRLRGVDRVVLAIGGAVLGLAAVAPEQAPATLRFVSAALAGIAPWLAVSVFFAAGAKATGADALVANAFIGRESRMIVAAALLGALSPFCSCGVIPVVAGLLAGGVPLAPVMAFWISSPLMDPEQFILLTAQLGTGFAIAKLLAALGMGLASGFATMALVRAGALADPLRIAPNQACGCRKKAAPSAPVWRFWRDAERSQRFLTEAAATAWFLVRWLSLAFVLESLMVAYIPSSTIAQWLGGAGAAAVPLAVAIGIPAYLNGYAAIPLVSGLIDLGMSPAAGLAFMVAGGVTSIPAAIAVYALAKPPTFAWYLALAIAGALAVGYGYAAALSIGA